MVEDKLRQLREGLIKVEDLGSDEPKSKIVSTVAQEKSDEVQHPNHKTKMCLRFAQGGCTFGANCGFAHNESELRSKSVPVALGGSGMPGPGLMPMQPLGGKGGMPGMMPGMMPMNMMTPGMMHPMMVQQMQQMQQMQMQQMQMRMMQMQQMGSLAPQSHASENSFGIPSVRPGPPPLRPVPPVGGGPPPPPLAPPPPATGPPLPTDPNS